jgi:hypothetical protein
VGDLKQPLNSRSQASVHLGQLASGRFAPIGDIVPAAKLPILRRRKSQENKCRINWDFRESHGGKPSPRGNVFNIALCARRPISIVPMIDLRAYSRWLTET